MNTENMLSRITRDIADGLIVLDLHGTVTFANPMASTLLGIDSLQIGSNYARAVMDGQRAENDEFHQFLIDSVYDKRRTHGGQVSYVSPDGTAKVFNLTSSFLFGSDGQVKEGVVIQFSDVTEEAELKEKNINTARGFMVLIAVLCIWIFFYAIWELLDRPIAGGVMTMLVEIVAISAFFMLNRISTISFDDFGMGTKGIRRVLLVDSLATAAVLAVMLMVKLYLIRYVPGAYADNPVLLDFSTWDIFDTIYPLTVVLQEVLTRGLMHETIKTLIPGKNANTMAIIVSSLFFGAIHIYLGLPYMIGAALLLGVFGVIYTRQRTIWGLCIPHYFLGMAVKVIFGF